MNIMWRSVWNHFHTNISADMKKIKDLKDRPLLLFVNSWSIRMVLERNEGLKLSEFGRS